MLFGTEVPVGGDTVPVKTTVKGTILTWNHRPGERTLSGEPVMIYKDDPLCAICYEGTDRLDIMLVGAPIKGYLVKIIREAKEPVEEGETIGEMVKPYEDEPSPQPFPWDPWDLWDTIPT